LYDAEFTDGSVESYSTNLIAENLYSQVDPEGRAYSVFKDIVGHKSNDLAVKRNDPLYLNGQRKYTTIGWDIEVEMEDGSSLFLPLKDVKGSNRIELAEYAIAVGIKKEPAFDWWV
jgi:hypothetical protein